MANQSINTFQFNRCKWTHCLPPPDLPDASNTGTGNLVEFEDTLYYFPAPGFHFEVDYDKTFWEVKCLSTGQYDINLEEMKTLDSKLQH